MSMDENNAQDRLKAAISLWREGRQSEASRDLLTAIGEGVTGAAGLSLQLAGAVDAPAELRPQIRAAIDAAAETPLIARHRAFLQASGYGGEADLAGAIAARMKTAQSGDGQACLEIALLARFADDKALTSALLHAAAQQGSGHAIAGLMRLGIEAGALPRLAKDRAQALAATGHPLAASLLQQSANLPVDERAHTDITWPDAQTLANAVMQCPPATSRLNDTPRIDAWQNGFPALLCDYLATGAAPLLQPAQIFDPGLGRFRPDPYRQSLTAAIPDDAMDLALFALKSRMAAMAGARFDQGEPISVLVYRPGEHYKAHYDYITEDGGPASADLAARGQRIGTSLIKLNEEYEGGATQFRRLDIEWTGRRGDALSFDNVDAGGAGDPMSLHAGLPVSSGMKILASLWTRER